MTSEATVPEAALKQESPEFRAWVETLPDAHWAKHDLSACRLGWEAGRAALPHLSTAIRDAALENEARFLIERLNELEQTISSGEPAEEIYREFSGHVAPSIARLRSTLKSIPAPAATRRHKKRGTEYVLLGYGRMQAESWADARAIADALLGLADPPLGDPPHTVDMREVAIYRSVTDPNETWVRPREEFEDGRFEVLPGAATTKGAHYGPLDAEVRAHLGIEPAPAEGNEAEAEAQVRRAFVVPDGYEAVRDAEGRATGEVRPAAPAQAPGELELADPDAFIPVMARARCGDENKTIVGRAVAEATWRELREKGFRIIHSDAIAALTRQEQRGAVEVSDDKALAVLPDGDSVCLSGRFAGWLMRRHPDGQWISVQKLERRDPTEGNPLAALATTPVHQEAGE